MAPNPTITVDEAATLLGVKPAEVEEVGERHGLPWAKTDRGIEYVWVGSDKVLHILWKPKTRTERELNQETSYAGLAIPRYEAPVDLGHGELEAAVATLEKSGVHPEDLVPIIDPPIVTDAQVQASLTDPGIAAEGLADSIDLDAATKGQLVEHAVGLGLTVPAKASKPQVRKLIDDAS